MLLLAFLPTIRGKLNRDLRVSKTALAAVVLRIGRGGTTFAAIHCKRRGRTRPDMAQRGGTQEQDQEAGRRGGEETASTQGREFYSEIGRMGGRVRSGNPDASAAHHAAASHHEAAAHHHRQAAFHHSTEDDDLAQDHAAHAEHHGRAASAQGEKARRHSSGSVDSGQRGHR